MYIIIYISSGCWRSLRFGNSANYAMMVSCKCECRKTMILSKLNDGSFGDFLKWGYPQGFQYVSWDFPWFSIVLWWFSHGKSHHPAINRGLPPWRKPYGIPPPQLEAGPSSGKSVFSIWRYDSIFYTLSTVQSIRTTINSSIYIYIYQVDISINLVVSVNNISTRTY